MFPAAGDTNIAIVDGSGWKYSKNYTLDCSLMYLTLFFGVCHVREAIYLSNDKNQIIHS